MATSNDVIRANRKYEGQSCAICKREISLGDLIHICPKCQSINHEDCWNNEGGCNSLSCNSLSSQSNYKNGGFSNNSMSMNDSGMNSFQQPSVSPSQNSFSRTPGARPNNLPGNRPMSSPMGGMGGGNPANMVPCRFCKEPIMRGARKCKHCGEYQRDEDRNQASQVEEGDLSFNIIEGLAIFCCPLIALIVGAVYCANGRPAKGTRMIKYSVGWMIASFILRVIMNVIAAG